jgi:hypothetical protein
MQQAKDNAKEFSKIGVNTARIQDIKYIRS